MKEKEMEQLLRFAIPKDGKFRFRCTGCGQCCYGHADIRLSPFDVGRMSEKLGIPRTDFLWRYTDMALGENSRFPMVTLRKRGADGGCVMLDGKECRVHGAKPTACALFPLGRAATVQSGEMALSYFLRPVGCGDSGEVHTPEEWMAAAGHAGSDEEFLVWSSVLAELAPLTEKLFPRLTEGEASEVANTVCFYLFCCYPPKADVAAQLRENAFFARRLLENNLGTFGD